MKKILRNTSYIVLAALLAGCSGSGASGFSASTGGVMPPAASAVAPAGAAAAPVVAGPGMAAPPAAASPGTSSMSAQAATTAAQSLPASTSVAGSASRSKPAVQASSQPALPVAANTATESGILIAHILSNISQMQVTAVDATSPADGECHGGEEVTVPDSRGDAHSIERKYFYGADCSQLAEDVVSIASISSGGTEKISQMLTSYPQGSATASGVRMVRENIQKASLDTDGVPNIAAGYAAQIDTTTMAAGAKIALISAETLVSPASSGTTNFCGDQAGVRDVTDAGTNMGLSYIFNGVRSVNANQTVTYSLADSASISSGAPGALSIAAGAASSTCPIGTPKYTVAGGTPIGTASLPLSVTYSGGAITSLTATNAQLPNGAVFSLQTASDLSPAIPGFISGAVKSAAGEKIATIAVNAFGDGALTAGNAKYPMTMWTLGKAE